MISLTIDIEVDDGFILAVCRGTFTATSAISALRRVLAAAERARRPSILVDCVAMQGDPPVVDLYEVASATAPDAPAHVSLALVCAPHILRPDRFFETALRNRGLRALVTSSHAQALRWLRQDEPATLPDPPER